MRKVVRVALWDLVTEFGTDDIATFKDKVDDDERRLTRIYSALAAWPADGQFAIHATAWILGPGAPLPAVRAAVNRPIPDFQAAAVAAQQWSNRGHSGVIAIVDRVGRAFRNAAVVVERALDPDRLYYPDELEWS